MKKLKKLKISNKGFTLIELLAVITIMGILMMVAIPAVSRTIENARRDTFANIAHDYINAVRNAMLADNIECNDLGSEWHVASANPAGVYYFPICTSQSNCEAICKSGDESIPCASGADPFLSQAQIQQSTSDLMESGGKSPFGNSEIQGYIRIRKDVDTEKGKTTIKYKILLMDTGGHGISSQIEESQVKRSAISTQIVGSTVTNINQVKEQIVENTTPAASPSPSPDTPSPSPDTPTASIAEAIQRDEAATQFTPRVCKVS